MNRPRRKMFNILLQAKKALTKIRLFARIISRSLSITVSTSGFHPDNAGSTPAEITTPVSGTNVATMGVFG